VFALPAGVTASDLDADQLLAGEEVSGRHGNTVFLAIPARSVGRQRLVVIATDQVETKVLSRATPLLLLAGSRAAPGRRRRDLVRPALDPPIRELERAAGQLAAGDLSGRADLPPEPTPTSPRSATRSTRWPRSSRTRAGASARSCSRSRTTCAPRSRRFVVTPKRCPTEHSTTPIPRRRKRAAR
jgi:hypothetical protein